MEDKEADLVLKPNTMHVLAGTCCELTRSRYLLADLHMPLLGPAVLHCDNQAILYFVANPVFHERTLYIDMDCHLIYSR